MIGAHKPPLWRGRSDGLLFLAFLVGGCGLSVLLRQDGGWDLQNYHLYNPFALLEGRLKVDLFAAGVQTYLNPLLDIPYYLLSMRLLPHYPRLVAALAGLPFGLMGYATWRITRVVLTAVGLHSRWDAAWATAIGLTGSTIYSEIGTTYGDMPTAVMVLWALQLLLRAGRSGEGQGRWIAAGVAGVLLGVAAGLKLTNVIYAPAAVVAMAVSRHGWRRARAECVAVCIGGIAGLAASFGWWASVVTGMFANPLFPHMNDLFGSPWFTSGGIEDSRFLPHSLGQVLFFPFYWFGSKPLVVSELQFRDGRFAAVYLAMAVIGAVALWAQRTVRSNMAQGTTRFGIARLRVACIFFVVGIARGSGPDRQRSRLAALLAVAELRITCVFFVVSYALWEWKFSTIRYAMPLEAICGIPIAIALRMSIGRSRRLRQALALIGMFLMATANYPGWGRLKHYGAQVFDIAPMMLEPDTTVIVADGPLSFLLPFLRGDGVSYVGIVEVRPDTKLWDEVSARIRRAPRLRVLLTGAPDKVADKLQAFGVTITPGTCHPLPNDFQRGTGLCAATFSEQAGQVASGSHDAVLSR